MKVCLPIFMHYVFGIMKTPVFGNSREIDLGTLIKSFSIRALEKLDAVHTYAILKTSHCSFSLTV